MVAPDAKDFGGADVFDFIVDVIAFGRGAFCSFEGCFIDFRFGFGVADFIGIDVMIKIREDRVVVGDVVDVGLKGVGEDDQAVSFAF